MRIVLFSRVPRWYSFREDRLVKRLAAEGHEVTAIVVEQTKTLHSMREWLWKLGPRVFWQKASGKALKRAGLGREVLDESEAVRASLSSSVTPPVHRVASHNSAECVKLVRSLEPDVIILRGCGIIRKPVLEIPKMGTINPHYALLPAYRGMDVTEWSALHGDPVAVSVHTVNEGVDTGAVITSRLVKAEAGDTVGGLRDKSAAIAVDLLAEAVKLLDDFVPAPAQEEANAGRQYFVMHTRLRELANERLQKVGLS